MTTSIEWTRGADGKPGDSWNPLRAKNKKTGGVGHYCVKVSPGCKHCYAERLQPRWRNFVRYAQQDRDLVELFLDEKVLQYPLHWKRPRVIFPCSMTDLFADFYPDEWIDAVIAVAALTPQHTYRCLTKRAERMQRYWTELEKDTERLELAARKIGRTLKYEGKWLVDFLLPNWQQGVSTENQETADERIPLLLKTPAALRWISAEPLLGPIKLQHYGIGTSLDWVVPGGESGHNARTTALEDIGELVRHGELAGVPVFVKQAGARPTLNGAALRLGDSKGGLMEEWPAELRVRQFPKVPA